MGRWRNAWWDLLRAYTKGEISQPQLRAITDRHRGLPANEETLQMLMSATAAAREEYMNSKAVEEETG